MKIHNILILALVSVLFACTKPSADENPLNSEWKLQSIENESGKTNVPNSVAADAYILHFDGDTAFMLPTSANQAGGKCSINTKEKSIFIHTYQEWTEVYQGDETLQTIDNALLVGLKSASSYSCSANKLTISGKGKSFVFGRKR